MGTTAQLGHPLFGPKVAKLYVYKWAWHDPSKSERKVLVVGRLEPSTIKDEEDLRERWGPGRYRVEGRDANGRVIGNAWDVDLPDENGVVPVGRPNEKPAPVDEGDDTVSTLLEVQARARADVLGPLEAQIKQMTAMHAQAMADARADRQADAKLFATLLESSLKVQAAQSGAGGGGAESMFQRYLEKRLDRLEDENKELRSKASESTLKLAKVDGKRGDVLVEAVAKGVDGFVDLMKAGAMERAAQRERERERSQREERREERRELPASSEKRDEGSEGSEGFAIPTAAEFAKFVRNGGVVSLKALRQFERLHRAGALADDLWAVVEPVLQVVTSADDDPSPTPVPPPPQPTTDDNAKSVVSQGVLTGSTPTG